MKKLKQEVRFGYCFKSEPEKKEKRVKVLGKVWWWERDLVVSIDY